MKNLLKLGLTACCPVLLSAQSSDNPNIIIILADDLGWGDVGYHESEILTPYIDKLASEGIILNRYYTATICSPTRAGLLTGRYPDRVGIRSTGITPWRDYGLDTTEVTLPEILGEAGYNHRAIIGKWHLGHLRPKWHPLNRGFTHFYGHLNGAIDFFTLTREGERDWHFDYDPSPDQGYATELISKRAVECIKEYHGEDPFFIFVSYNAPHTPLQAPLEDLLLYGYDETQPQFGNASPGGEGYLGRGNNPRQTYSAMVTNMDRGIGQILETLRELDIEDNTLVLFHSDNGAGPGGSSGPLRGRKYREWEGGVRAPAIIKWPAVFSGHWQSEQVMGYVDVVPTIREIVGIKDEPRLPLDGVSVLQQLKYPEQQFDRNLYLGYGTIVNQHWKLIKAGSGAPHMDLEEDMLFKISVDPYENENVTGTYKNIYLKLNEIVKKYDAIEVDTPVLPWGEGQEDFVAPKDWNIFNATD